MRFFLTAAFFSLSLGCTAARVQTVKPPKPARSSDTSLWVYKAAQKVGRTIAKNTSIGSDPMEVIGTQTKDKLIEDGLIAGLLNNGVKVLEKLNNSTGTLKWEQPTSDVFYPSMLTTQNIDFIKHQGAKSALVYRLMSVKEGTNPCAKKSEPASITAMVRLISTDNGRILSARRIKEEYREDCEKETSKPRKRRSKRRSKDRRRDRDREKDLDREMEKSRGEEY